MDARKTLADPARRASDEQDIRSPEPTILSAEQVCLEYAPRVYSVARRMVGSDFDAEDVTQDVLLQVVRKLPEFRGESALPTWLHRVTVNAALTHRRRQAVRDDRRPLLSLDAHGEDEPVAAPGSRPAPPPDEQVVGHELKQLIDRAVEELPESYREVFVLADIEGLPNADIAHRLGMSLPAVKSRLHRARAMLRDALSPHLTA
jgi:RNA polymerase sigma-70 factor (ECF subfamily)